MPSATTLIGDDILGADAVNLPDSILQSNAQIPHRTSDNAILLDFRSFTSAQSIDSTVNLARETNYNSIISFHKFLDTDGSVLNPITKVVLKPCDNGYSEDAQYQASIYSPLRGLSVADNRSSEEEVSINLNSHLVPLVVVDNRKVESETYFDFEEANTD